MAARQPSLSEIRQNHSHDVNQNILQQYIHNHKAKCCADIVCVSHCELRHVHSHHRHGAHTGYETERNSQPSAREPLVRSHSMQSMQSKLREYATNSRNALGDEKREGVTPRSRSCGRVNAGVDAVSGDLRRDTPQVAARQSCCSSFILHVSPFSRLLLFLCGPA